MMQLTVKTSSNCYVSTLHSFLFTAVQYCKTLPRNTASTRQL